MLSRGRPLSGWSSATSMRGNTIRTRLFAIGVMVAVLMLLQRQLRLAPDVIHAFETRVGLALVPSAVVLGVVLLLYFQCAVPRTTD